MRTELLQGAPVPLPLEVEGRRWRRPSSHSARTGNGWDSRAHLGENLSPRWLQCVQA